MHTSEILNRAADLIQERGWIQGENGWNLPDEGLCLEGGIMAAAEIGGPSALAHLWKCPAHEAVTTYLELPPARHEGASEGRETSTWGWNDAKGRTAAEVIEVLRACAVIEASRERVAVTS